MFNKFDIIIFNDIINYLLIGVFILSISFLNYLKFKNVHLGLRIKQVLSFIFFLLSLIYLF